MSTTLAVLLSARGLAQFKTRRISQQPRDAHSVLDCGGPPPLLHHALSVAAPQNPNGILRREFWKLRGTRRSNGHQIQSPNVLEVTSVEGGELAAALSGRRGYNQVE